MSILIGRLSIRNLSNLLRGSLFDWGSGRLVEPFRISWNHFIMRGKSDFLFECCKRRELRNLRADS
jgi:hypothetical protein